MELRAAAALQSVHSVGRGLSRGHMGCLSSLPTFALLCSLPELFGRQRQKPEASPWGFEPQSFSRQWGAKIKFGARKRVKAQGAVGKAFWQEMVPVECLGQAGLGWAEGCPFPAESL